MTSRGRLPHGLRAPTPEEPLKDRIVHMIGNAHIDAVWLWQWQEGFQEVKATFRSALDRLNESDDFVFTSSSAAYYWRLEGHDPGMFEEIKARVAEGRWVMCGGWWVQADTNIPSGESLVRHGLYSQRYLREKLGATATVGYNPDAFGQSAMLPQILRGQGMDAYVFLRPEPHEKSLPGTVFAWESDDGSRVLGFRIPFGYATGSGDLERVVRRVLPDLRAPYDEVMCFYGVGNHGGGPTRANLASIRALDADPTMPRLLLSSPPAYFSAMRSKGIEFPVVHDELQHHARGCYSAHSGVKRWNRQAEHLLAAAEAWSTVADSVAGEPYPSVFPGAWRSVMFNQFHDVIAGSSIEAAYDDARDLYGEAMSLGHRALNNALQSISWRIAIGRDPRLGPDVEQWNSGSVPIVVFNSNAWDARVPVEVETAATGPIEGLADDAGSPVPVQEVASVAAVGESRRRVVFLADLPALGYRLFRLRMPSREPFVLPAADDEADAPEPEVEREADAPEPEVERDAHAGAGAATTPHPATPPAAERAADADRAAAAGADTAGGSASPGRAGEPLVLENALLRVEVNPETGCLSRIYDRHAEFDLLRGEAARPVVIADASDTWGHGMTRLDDEIGVFEPVATRLLEAGPVRRTVRVTSRWHESLLHQDFMIYEGLPLLHVNVVLDWREQHRALKLRFPVDLLLPRATYEIPYGHIERATDGAEEPGQRWVDMTGLRPDRRSLYGLSLLNDAKYGFDVRAEKYRGNVHYAEMGMTVARSPIYAHHDPYEPQEDVRYEYLDQGVQRFSYALLPHAGSWAEAGTVRRAIELNQRPIAIVETVHDGPLPTTASFVTVDRPNIAVSVLKRAEDDDDIVVRAYETDRVATTATLALPAWGRTLEVAFRPCEIKTLKIPRDPARAFVETNLVEWT